MCIDGKKPGHYRCCCVFDNNFFVYWAASIEVFNLFEGIKYKATTTIILSAITLSVFAVMFFMNFRKVHPLTRKILFFVYLGSIVSFLIYFAILCSRESFTGVIQKYCDEFNHFIHHVWLVWRGCESAFASKLWVIYSLYAVAVSGVRGAFAWVLRVHWKHSLRPAGSEDEEEEDRAYHAFDDDEIKDLKNEIYHSKKDEGEQVLADGN